MFNVAALCLPLMHSVGTFVHVVTRPCVLFNVDVLFYGIGFMLLQYQL